jgi:hypothetical protein
MIDPQNVNEDFFNGAFEKPLSFGEEGQFLAVSKLLYPDPEQARAILLTAEEVSDLNDEDLRDVKNGEIRSMWAQFGTAQADGEDWEAGEEMWVLGSLRKPHTHPVYVLEIGY